jgi:hypothetical protein
LLRSRVPAFDGRIAFRGQGFACHKRCKASPDIAPEARTRVFISYSRRDLAFADQLEAALRTRGFEPLIDRTQIYAFEEW